MNRDFKVSVHLPVSNYIRLLELGKEYTFLQGVFNNNNQLAKQNNVPL
jgi:hypothetical protein